MSLGYEFAPIDVSIMTHPKACKAGPEAMGLWLWGQTYAKLHGTAGRLHRHAVLTAWGGRRNIMLAKRLEASGLWLAREDGDWDVHNFEAKSAAKQSSSAKRMRDLRDRRKAGEAVTGDTVVRHGDANGDAMCSTSHSTSSSGSGSSGGEGGAADWWAAAIATAEQAVGGTIDQPVARWLEYDSARERKGWARNQRDAVGWLTTVIRSERKNARLNPKPAEITKQPFDPDAPWIKLGDTGS